MKNNKLKIKEIIIVEGRDDITALKRVIEGHIISLNGFSSLTNDSLEKLVSLSKKNDIILFTDPDFAGKKIREIIQKKIPNIKHAFISRQKATKNHNIGVENASDESIKEALLNVISTLENHEKIYSTSDLLDNNLCSSSNSKARRIMLGDILKIGYYNSKQLLNALNSFNIPKNEFLEAIKQINKIY